LSNGGLISGAFSSDTTLSTPVAINKGGTGQTSAQSALDVLAAASGSLVQGDIFIVDSSTNVVRLARGSDDQALVMNGSNPNWEAAGGGATVTKVSAVMGSDFSTASTSDVDVTDFVATLPTITSGLAWITATAETRVSLAQYLYYFSMDNGATVAARAPYSGSPSNPPRLPTNVVYIDDADGGTIQMLLRTQAGTAYVYGEGISGLQILGVG